MSFAEHYGPWAVIAGASEGTGREIARRVCANGVPCVLVARREAPLIALAEQIRAESGTECAVATVDLAAADALDRIVAAVGPRDVGLFVSNAGGDTNGSAFLDRDIEPWLELARRNVITTMQCCHQFAGPMRARGKGGLLLVNSGACYGGAGSMAVYSATKAFMLCFAEGLWSELRQFGVDVLTLVLGRTDTPAFRKILAERGLPIPDNLASAEAVARVGLDRLAHGPVHNWDLDDDVAGYAPTSAAQRRERVLLIDKASARIFGEH